MGVTVTSRICIPNPPAGGNASRSACRAGLPQQAAPASRRADAGRCADRRRCARRRVAKQDSQRARAVPTMPLRTYDGAGMAFDLNERASGVLLHPTRCPGPHGCGDSGPRRTRSPTGSPRPGSAGGRCCRSGRSGYGNSPYSALSAFAGNPLLVGLERAGRARAARAGATRGGARAAARPRRLRGGRAPSRRARCARPSQRFAPARREPRALRARSARASAPGWTTSRSSPRSSARTAAAPGRRGRRTLRAPRAGGARPRATRAWRTTIAFAASSSSSSSTASGGAARRTATQRGIGAHRRHADLRGPRQRRRLGAPASSSTSTRDGRPTVVAGVPPDYFSATGQRWGNPLYRWERMRERGYALVDRALPRDARALRRRAPRPLHRLPARYWEIPARRADGRARPLDAGARARRSSSALRRALGRLPLIAEDLGVVTPEVSALRDASASPASRSCSSPSATIRGARPSCRTTTARRASSTPARTTTTPPSAGSTTGRRARARRAGETERDVRCATSAADGARDPLGHDPRGARLGGRTWRSSPCRTCSGLGSRGAHEPARHGRAATGSGGSTTRPRPEVARAPARAAPQPTAASAPVKRKPCGSAPRSSCRDDPASGTRTRSSTSCACARSATQRRRHRRLRRAHRQARLPAGSRRHRALAPALLSLARPRRRLRHLRLHRRAPRRRHARRLPRASSTRRTAAGCASITELVLNHTSDQHPWFQRARRAPPGSPERDFYVWSDTPDRYRDARIIFKDFEPSNWSWDPVAKPYYWHRFFAHQPDLNFDNPAVHEAMLGVVDFWFGLGVDGLRLDAVPYLYEREGTNCENLPRDARVPARAARARRRSASRTACCSRRRTSGPRTPPPTSGSGDECHMNFHFPDHAAHLHVDSHGGPASRSSTSSRRRRRSRRAASGRSSCATTTS